MNVGNHFSVLSTMCTSILNGFSVSCSFSAHWTCHHPHPPKKPTVNQNAELWRPGLMVLPSKHSKVQRITWKRCGGQVITRLRISSNLLWDFCPFVISDDSHKHDCLNKSWTRMISIGIPKWKGKSPWGFNHTQKQVRNAQRKGNNLFQEEHLNWSSDDQPWEYTCW